MRWILACLAVIAGLALGLGWVAEYWGGLRPCVLCWYQRIAYMALLGIAGFGAFMAFYQERCKSKAASCPPSSCCYASCFSSVCLPKIFFVLSLLALFVNGAIAAYQVAVESKWVHPPAVCGEGLKAFVNLSIEHLSAQLHATPTVPCDHVAWSLFGISMAGYNALFCFMLIFAAVCAYRRCQNTCSI